MATELSSEDLVNIRDLLQKEKIDGTDILIVEDEQNTKFVTFNDFIKSLISDEEVAASTRIWSSKKLEELLSDAEKKSNKKIGKIQETVDDIDKTAVTQNELDRQLKSIENEKADKSTVTGVINALGDKRSKTDKLTSGDFSCSTESEKFHMEHLGQDIIAAMTGESKIQVASVPKGGWKTDDLGDGIITGDKLSYQYRFKGAFTEGSINTYVEDGLYLLGSEVENLPKYEVDETDPKLMEATRFGEAGKYIIQKVYYIDQDDDVKRPFYFSRIGEVDKIHLVDFIPHYEVTENNKVEAPLLGSTYNNRGTVKSGDVYDIIDNGNYLCTKTVTSLPTQDNYLLNIRSYGETVEYCAKTVENTGSKEYTSFIYYDSAHMPVKVPWFCTGTNLKSKFDGKNVHIFGDGIIYGIGATSITENSIPALLNSKYGYTIYNHALTDATYGNYQNDVLKERSVLTQIDTATQLDKADYVIIFAGSNDYKKGMCEIGSVTDTTNTTFKGSVVNAVEKLLTINPEIKILLVTPVYRASINSGDGHDCESTMINDKYLSDFSNAIIDAGKTTHVPVLNLFEESMISKYTKDTYLFEGGIYLSDKGHALVTDKIHSAMCRFY